MENKNELTNTLVKIMTEEFSKDQERPNQYVVGIFNFHTDELLGYHYDTFCNKGMNIFDAKRYSGDNPYGQLATIFKNLTHTFNEYPHEGFLSGVCNKAREAYGDLNLSDIYIDAVYLEEEISKQSFKYSVLNTENES